MNKLEYGSYDHNNPDAADTPYLASKGYTAPPSEQITREQFGFPLKEIKTFLGNTMPVKGADVVQLEVNDNNTLSYRTTAGGALTDLTGGIPSGGTTGQILVKNSNTDYDTAWANAFSFVGMVVMGTNLTTEASVKAIYGDSTSWTLLSSVILASDHVFGNGKTLGFTDGHKNMGTTINGYTFLGSDKFGYDVDTAGSYSGITANFHTMGIPTKAQLGEHPEYSGLSADTKTVYSWERTA